eukprot:jgi/Mesvir1/21532/Mv03973-RA.2
MSGLDAAAIALRRKQTTDARAQLQRLEALLARARSGALKLPDGGAKLERNICDLKREVELQERESTAAEAVQSTTLAVPSISTPSGPIKSTTAIQSTTSLAVPPRATSADEMNVLTAAIGQLSISHGQGVNNGDPPTLSVAQLRQRVASQSGRITTREETKFAERGISCRHGKLGPLGGALSVDAVRRTRARLEAEEAALREGGGGRQLHLLSCARPLESEEVLRDEMGDEVGDEVRDEMRTASSVPSNPQQSPSPARGAGGYFDAGASSAGARASSGARAAIQGELPAPCDMEGVQGPGGVAREASDSGALESSSAASLSSAASSWSAAANASSPAGRDAAGGAGTGTDGSNGAPRKVRPMNLPPLVGGHKRDGFVHSGWGRCTRLSRCHHGCVAMTATPIAAVLLPAFHDRMTLMVPP